MACVSVCSLMGPVGVCGHYTTMHISTCHIGFDYILIVSPMLLFHPFLIHLSVKAVVFCTSKRFVCFFLGRQETKIFNLQELFSQSIKHISEITDINAENVGVFWYLVWNLNIPEITSTSFQETVPSTERHNPKKQEKRKSQSKSSHPKQTQVKRQQLLQLFSHFCHLNYLCSFFTLFTHRPLAIKWDPLRSKESMNMIWTKQSHNEKSNINKKTITLFWIRAEAISWSTEN